MRSPDARAGCLLASALLFAGCGACPRATAPQQAGASSSLADPGPDPVPTASEPPVQLALPELAESEETNAILIAGRVFPVGWSPGGLFAYAYEPPDEACGCYFFRLIVQDLADGQIVWEHKYDSGDVQEGNPDQLTSGAAVWRERGAALSAKLAALGVVRHTQPSLTAFDDAAKVVQIHTTRMPEADSIFGFAYLRGYRVDLVSGDRTQTLINSAFGTPEDPDVGPLRVSVPGYLKSPFGPRVAVLIQEEWRGWEGRPHVVQLRFAGAELTSPTRP